MGNATISLPLPALVPAGFAQFFDPASGPFQQPL